jgi:hypothetical protein
MEFYTLKLFLTFLSNQKLIKSNEDIKIISGSYFIPFF